MVLQRGKPNTIWGWSEPGDRVRVEIAGNASAGVAGADGRWQVQIQPPPPGGPYTVKITGRQKAELHEVLVGDVWLCGGQSNMQLGLRFARNGAEEVKSANHPEIRFYVVQQHAAYGRAAVPRGIWRVVSPQTAADAEAGELSAVAYFFARRPQQDISVPIGLIQDCLGGTPAETWMSADALRQLNDFDVALAEVRRLQTRGGPEYGSYVMHWYDEYAVGLKGGTWAGLELASSRN